MLLTEFVDKLTKIIESNGAWFLDTTYISLSEEDMGKCLFVIQVLFDGESSVLCCVYICKCHVDIAVYGELRTSLTFHEALRAMIEILN